MSWSRSLVPVFWAGTIYTMQLPLARVAALQSFSQVALRVLPKVANHKGHLNCPQTGRLPMCSQQWSIRPWKKHGPSKKLQTNWPYQGVCTWLWATNVFLGSTLLMVSAFVSSQLNSCAERLRLQLPSPAGPRRFGSLSGHSHCGKGAGCEGL